MGVRLSIDKHVSNLHELLEMSAQYFQKVRFASKISDDIKQHLKIWRFQEDNSKFDAVRSSPMPLTLLQQSNFSFSSKESYLCLFIYQAGYGGLNPGQEQHFPPNLLGVLQSSLNMLTAESLNRIVSTNESESILSGRGFHTHGDPVSGTSDHDEYRYILFVWDGIETSGLTKANALAKAVELQALFFKAKDAVLKVLFSGGVIRGKKLQRGSVYVMSDLIDQQRNSNQGGNTMVKAETPIDAAKMATFYERILLLNCIVSSPRITQLADRQGPSQNFSKLKDLFQADSSQNNYWKRFDAVSTINIQTSAPIMAPPVKKKMPQIPSLGPNLGKLGFTDLKQDSNEGQQELNQVAQQPVIQPKKPMGLGLNLASVTREVEEHKQPDATQAKPRIVPSVKLGLVSRAQPDAEMREESQVQPPPFQIGKIPSLKLGEFSKVPDPQTSYESAGKPKMSFGLGLDLSKAQKLQQDHLALAEEKKSHAREIASNAQIPRGNRVSNQTPDAEMNSNRQDESSEFGTPSSQGQGESYRDNSNLLSEQQQRLAIENIKIEPEQLNDEDFDYRGTSRKEYENEYYKRVCSVIIDDFLYLGGDLVAKDAEVFSNLGLTHVINCAADYSDDYHKSKGVSYKSYHLKDHTSEDIACIFYDALQFISDAKAAGGKIFVHCVQGISRSATICIAYMMMTEGIPYAVGHQRVKERRACVNPNMTFIQQLMWWEKRHSDPNFFSLPINPRVFCLMSHQENDPQRIVCKLITQNFYQRGNRYQALDPRGMAVIQTERSLYIWVGNELPKVNHDSYMKAAKVHAALLQRYERAQSQFQIVQQGQEDITFWQAFGLEERPETNAYSKSPEMSHLYINLNQKREAVRNTVVQQMDEYMDEVQREKLFKPKLFNYPEWDSPIAVFDFEELENTEAMLVLCVRKDEGQEYREDHACYVWAGPDFDISNHEESETMDENEFVQKCIQEYWGAENAAKLNIKICTEQYDIPSDAFQHFFD